MPGDTVLWIAQILFAAAMGESVCEFLFMPLIDLIAGKLGEEQKALLKRTWSAVVGVGIAFNYSLDLFAVMGMRGLWPYLGIILTGTLVGRGSNALHGFIEKWIANAAIKKAQAVLAVRNVMK